MFCPHCGVPFTVPEELGGQETRCPRCSGTVQLPRSMFGARRPDGEEGPSEAPIAAGGPGATDQPAPPELLDDLERQTLDELEKIRNPKGSWGQAVLLLLVSLGLFVALGKRHNPALFTVSLIGILLFHELGHYLGMRLFGYRNVRMFFIPLFGAAVSGRKTSAESYKEAIVTLLGPLPGIYLALVLLGVLLAAPIPKPQRMGLLEVVVMLAVLNGFNLLPIMPLDGGRFLNQVLFSRNRTLESAFQLVAGVVLVLMGLSPGARILLLLGIWMLIGVVPGFRINGIARRAKERFGPGLTSSGDPVPVPVLCAVCDEARSTMSIKDAKTLARVVLQVWEKMHVKPPGAAATAALLVVYVGSLVALVVVPAVMLVMARLARG